MKLLARHRVLSAPVVDVNAPEDASWIDRYLGIVEFAGIVVWILQQVHSSRLDQLWLFKHFDVELERGRGNSQLNVVAV